MAYGLKCSNCTTQEAGAQGGLCDGTLHPPPPRILSHTGRLTKAFLKTIGLEGKHRNPRLGLGMYT